MKRLITTLLILVFATYTSKASHIIGGELTWSCITSGSDKGKFIFTVRKYRTCKVGASTFVGVPTISSPFGPSIAATLKRQYEIGLPCYDPNQSMNCFGGTVPKQINVIEVFEFESAPVALIGQPAVNGSVFYATDCCRPSGVTNTSSTGSFVWRAIMYPYIVNGITENFGDTTISNCYDNSPYFIADPPSALCNKVTVNYNIGVTDNDGDSISVSFAEPWGAVNSSIAYNTGFSYNNPLPSSGVPSSTANVAATISNSGVLNFTAVDTGLYSVVFEVNSFRNGQKIATIYREIPINIINCPPLPPPFPPNTYNSTPTHSLKKDTTSIISPYQITVNEGEFVELELSGFDSDLLPGLIAQSITIEASGSIIANGFTDSTSGCSNPPCLTIDTSLGNFNQTNQNWKDQTTLALPIKWQTSCSHLNYINGVALPQTYQLNFLIHDDYCQIPGQTRFSINITVVPDTVDSNSVSLDSLNSNNGMNSLYWQQNTAPGFSAYYIYKYSSTTSSLSLLKVESNSSTTSYTDPNGKITDKYYVALDSTSLCEPSYLYTPIQLSSTQNYNSSVSLKWNSPIFSNNSSNINYLVYKSLNNGSMMLLDSTAALKYIDTSINCQDSIRYKIVARVNGTFFTGSNIQSLRITGVASTIPNINTLITNHATGDVELFWDSIPVDDSVIVSYLIYQRTGTTGTFTLVDSVTNPNTRSYKHIGAGANTSSIYYYIKVNVLNNCGPGAVLTKRSNIIKTISFSILNPNNGLLNLNWDSFYNEASKSTNGKYYISYRINTPVWTFIDSTNFGSESYTHPIQFCKEDIEYKVEMDSMNVTVIALNQVNIDGYEIELSVENDTSLRGLAGTNAKWYLGDSLVMTGTHIYTPKVSGTYYYTVTLPNGCDLESKGYVYTSVGVIETTENHSMQLFPNPNDGTFNLQFEGSFGEKLEILIQDRIGRVIHRAVHSNEQQGLKIQLPEDTKGLYLVKVISDGEVFIQKVLVQ